MCLAIAGKVIAMENDLATIEYDGIIKTAGKQLVPKLIVGDWVLVHAGFVIQILDENYAMELKKLQQEAF